MSISPIMLLFDAAVAAAPLASFSPVLSPTALGPQAPIAVDRGAGEELASHLGQGYRVSSTGHFLVVHHGDAAPLAALLENDRRRFFGLFAAAGFTLREREAPLVWVLCDDHRQLDTLGLETEHRDLSWLDAWYSPRTNRVALVRASSAAGVDVGHAAHELAHQLAFNSGLMERGVDYPVWVVEGLADHFAGLPSAPDVTRSRLPLVELVRLVRVPDDDPATADAVYEEAQSLFGFLFAEHRAALASYLAALAAFGPGVVGRGEREAQFVAAFGELDALERAWADSRRPASP